MKQTLHLIALRTIKHSDRNSILKALSLELGPLSLLQPAGSGREANRRRALLMPLGLVQAVADIRPGREIHPCGQISPLHPLASLRANPVKSALAVFLAETLGLLMHDNQPDRKIWNFIHKAIITLDTLPTPRTANFHIAFLIRLAPLLGIAPDASSYAKGKIFDMLAGSFRSSAPAHHNFLNPSQSAFTRQLLRMNFRNMHFYPLSRTQRAQLLDFILQYYSLHLAPLNRLRSLPVLATLF